MRLDEKYRPTTLMVRTFENSAYYKRIAGQYLLELGLQAWRENKIYIDNNGNYRYQTRPRRIALYNMALKRLGSVERVHALAHRKPTFGQEGNADGDQTGTKILKAMAAEIEGNREEIEKLKAERSE